MADTSHGNDRAWWASEDWLAVWLGAALLGVGLVAVLAANNTSEGSADPISNPLSALVAKPGGWAENPLDSLGIGTNSKLPGVLGALLISGAIFGTGVRLMGERARPMLIGFIGVFLLALVALVCASNARAKAWNLEYALWALALGMLISNSVGTPNWLKPALRTEFYIKTGLVLYGAKVLVGQLVKLGLPGLCVAWVVTPVVLITTYWFGQKILRIASPRLNMVISADMSVCGVSAAIATAAACRARKEELSLAIGISLTFTVIMMVIMPTIINATGMNEIVGGAWIGGTIDSTGAVAAAGDLVGPAAGKAAITIKLIQNILIGVTAFGVATYWVRYVESDAEVKPDVWEIWYRFPKFVIGFLGASLVFSLIDWFMPRGDEIVKAVLNGGPDMKQGVDTLRSWFFALAFVSIGLETNFRELGQYLRGGKPLVLYVCGQTLNLCLTLLMAWLMFGVVFKEVTNDLLN